MLHQIKAQIQKFQKIFVKLNSTFFKLNSIFSGRSRQVEPPQNFFYQALNEYQNQLHHLQTINYYSTKSIRNILSSLGNQFDIPKSYYLKLTQIHQTIPQFSMKISIQSSNINNHQEKVSNDLSSQLLNLQNQVKTTQKAQIEINKS
jgi:hypothetical protein